tara:strand:- start:765 stop:1592 length:828 start_codon:yes stop_codon:yes gene_type:complete
MEEKIQIDFIIPSYKSEILTSLAIKSFEKYKGDFEFRYIVVENASDESYKEKISSLAEQVVWVSNKQQSGYLRAAANAEAIEVGLDYVESDLVFICHNDTVACSENWMNFLYQKIQEGNFIAGTLLDNSRIQAVHISGMLLKTELAKKVSCYPILDEDSRALAGLPAEKIEEIKSTRQELDVPQNVELDVGDSYTRYCRLNDIKHFSCKNTHNVDIELTSPYSDFPSDRAVDDSGEVIFMHLGRGIAKQDGNYHKRGKSTYSGWKDFVIREVLGE